MKENDSPSVRLATNKALIDRGMGTQAPSLRLAAGAPLTTTVGGISDAPSVRLAHAPGARGDNALLSGGPSRRLAASTLGASREPSLLVSYVYLKQFLAKRQRFRFRDWVLDSGAFSAWNSGASIELAKYTATAKRLLESDQTLVEVFALDVIDDWQASLRNAEYMWTQGVPAIPTFHIYEPREALKELARRFPKIAIGGVARARGGDKTRWLDQVFAEVWPKKIHGFAACGREYVLRFPFHSVDSTSWEVGAAKFGSWRAYGGGRLSVRGSNQNLRVEVEHYLKLEDEARVRWLKEMALLEQPEGG